MSGIESMIAIARKINLYLVLLLAGVVFATSVQASDYAYPWRDRNKAIVIDAYEKNPIDWAKMLTDKRIRGFIAKSSDGLASPWTCRGNNTERKICKKSFQNYWMKQQLYHTRRALAKTLGLKWGAYHLGRPGNPVAQANHFLQFAKPEKDELIALDIEHDDPKKWISFADAEIFAKHIYKRIGRYPVLYTNHETAKRIAARRDEFPILSRMQLWYARFKGDVRGSFPMGNWDSYTIWQFSAHPNCNKRRCLYRVPGTETNIDVNITKLSINEFDKAWPFDGLVPERPSEPEVLMVEAEKPVVEVDDKLTVASISQSPGSDASEQSSKIEAELGKDAKFQIAGIDLKSIAIPTARFRDVAVAKVETPVHAKPVVEKPIVEKTVEVASVDTQPVKEVAKEEPVAKKQNIKPVTVAVVSPEIVVQKEPAKNVDPGEIVAGENFGPIGNLKPRLLKKPSVVSDVSKDDHTPSPRYLKDVTLLIGESPYGSL